MHWLMLMLRKHRIEVELAEIERDATRVQPMSAIVLVSAKARCSSVTRPTASCARSVPTNGGQRAMSLALSATYSLNVALRVFTARDRLVPRIY
jgi:hypothetical protein